MMVLHLDERQIAFSLPARAPTGSIDSWDVHRRPRRRAPSQRDFPSAWPRGVPGIEGLAVFNIADMLRHKTGRLAVRPFTRERNRGLLLWPAGEHTGRSAVERRQRQRLGCISASAANGHNGVVDHAYHRVVVARQNRAVVTEQRVGDAGGNEVFPGKVVVGLDGFFTQVSAGHDERVHTAASAVASNRC